MSRSSLSGRSHLLVFVAAVTLLALVFGLQPAGSVAARAPGTEQESRGALAGDTGKLIAKYTTADSDTYELPDGHMLTRVFSQPDTGGGALQALAPDGALSSPASEAAPAATPALATQGSGSAANELSCTIDKSTPTTSECDAATFRAGYEPTTQERPVHGLLQFALPDLDNDVTVLNAKLELYETASTTTNEVALSAAPVLTPWSAGVTWDTTNGSTAWETPGGDYVLGNNADTALAEAGTAKGWHYWYPTEVLQKWLNGTGAPREEGQPNFGLLVGEEIEGSINNIVSFAGNGHTDAPALTFEWIQRGIGSAANYTMLPVPVSASTSLEVNAASGNLMAKSSDLTIASRGTPFDVARIFNSLAPEQFGYGAGWSDVNTPHIEVNSNGSLRYVSSSGNTFVFDREGLSEGKPAGLRPPPQLQSGSEEAVMCESSGGNPDVCPSKLPKSATYDLWYLKTEEQILFKGTSGTIYPLAVEYIGNELETPTYTTGKVLPTSWTDSAKEAITYTESATLGYTAVAYEAKKESVTYTEKADAAKVDKLVEVTNATKEKTTYTYGTGAEEGLLTKIEEPGGVLVNISYDSEKQVAKIVTASTAEHPTGSTTTYTYYELGKAPSPCTATQKATVVTETEGSEEPTTIYCANVLDEVENVSRVSTTGQTGWYALEDEADSETETASVNLSSGNLLVKAEDVTPEAADQYLSLDRFYNSQSMPAGSTLGPRWRWGTGPSVYLVNEGDIVVLHGPSGYTVALKPTSESTYSAPEEFEGTLTKNANGTYTLANEDNPTYQFNAAGVLTSETTEEGNTFTVNDTTLSGKSVLHSLAPASGKALEVTYNGTPLVTQTTDPAGRIRKYEYNGSGQLATYTTPSGTKTEYEYSNGYLSKIKTPEATETITTVSGKVSEVSVTRAGETGTSGEKFSYQGPTAPTCNPASDVEETVVTHLPGEEKQSFCFNARGENTTPLSESDQEEIEGEGEQPEISEAACKEEHPGTYCGEEEVPPESNEEGEEDASLATAKPAGEPVLVPGKELEASHYGIADNNRVTPREGHPGFDIFTNPYFQALHVVTVRRTIEWNLVYEAERAPIPNESEETKQRQQYAKGLLKDLEEWITEVDALPGGVPVITFEHCHEPGYWVNPEPEAKDALVHCDEPAGPLAYKVAIEKFLSHKLKNSKEEETGPEIGHAVHRYTAWDEPDNKGLVPGSSEHVEPTYNKPKLAGEYWFELDELCRVDKYGCQVAAGDFLDADLPDVWHEKTTKHQPNPYYAWMKEYLNGMHYPRHANRWAWHAYEDGEESQTKFKGTPKKWWWRFKYFAKVVMKYDPNANIWLLEQGAVFTEPGRKLIPQKDEGLADDILSAFVKDGKHQLTLVDRQIKEFYYYEMRVEDKEHFETFDSGLLEEKPEHEGEETYNGRPPSTPRHIYSIYKAKTPKTG
jgi:YD repeat-containing protein